MHATSLHLACTPSLGQEEEECPHVAGWPGVFPSLIMAPDDERTTDALSKSLNIHLFDGGHLAISVSMGDVLAVACPRCARLLVILFLYRNESPRPDCLQITKRLSDH